MVMIDGTPCPEFDVEIRNKVMWFKGSTRTQYYANAELNSLKYRDGWFNTEDIFELQDNQYVFKGRDADTVKVKGMFVNPAEVEGRIVELDFVKQAGVYLKDGILKAKIVADNVPENFVHQVKRHIQKSLIAYKAPEDVTVVSELPVTAAGKIDRWQLDGS